MEGDYVHKIDISLSFQEIYLEHTHCIAKKKKILFWCPFSITYRFESEIEIEQENDYIFFFFFWI